MTPAERIAAVRARLKAATAAPWEYTAGCGDVLGPFGVDGAGPTGRRVIAEHIDHHNAALIAAAPADLAWLCAEVERMAAVVDAARVAVDGLDWNQDGQQIGGDRVPLRDALRALDAEGGSDAER